MDAAWFLYIFLQIPPTPVGVHQNSKLKDQIDDKKREEGRVVPFLSPRCDTDLLESYAQLDDGKDESDDDEVEAECGDVPPVEGELEVEAGIVMADGGRHGDLEEEEEDEEAEEQTAPVRDTGEEGGGSTQGLQLQVVREHEDTHHLVTHAEVPVQHVQEAVLVGGVPAHEEEVEGEARHGDQQQGGGGDNGEDIPHILQQVFNNVPISYSGQC